ncbi:MAG: S-adenosylmethionine:tRNA ribosyltransferase-isomerase [Candidatus Melainabacteria bacterium]|nr:S-adenosylmethionine:tRNA ribosyltransferase-isomerase [Candidatus Melainabacteria bacterium]
MSDLPIKNSDDSPVVGDFEYDLPFELIAQEPLLERSKSRLLNLNKATGDLHHCYFENLVELLQAGDLLVLNNTKVIPARLIAKRHSGGMIKLLLLKQVGSSPRVWEALVTPIKRLKPGERLTVPTESGKSFEISVAGIEIGFDGFKRLIVDLGEPENVWQLLNQAGYAPLPPYIVRDYASDGDTDDGAHSSRLHIDTNDSNDKHSSKEVSTKDTPRVSDLNRYQTVFAKEPGAVAAPTAGLHFTDELLETLQAKGVEVHYLTLHVGAGTFKPMTDSLDEHKIEPERFTISHDTADAINRAKAEKRRVIAVGTTSLRALETAGETGRVLSVEDGVTHLFVKPGYEFKIADGLITNFHLSKSSLLVLVSAFAGRDLIMRAYQEAIEQRYRFYSYGDACLIL